MVAARARRVVTAASAHLRVFNGGSYGWEKASIMQQRLSQDLGPQRPTGDLGLLASGTTFTGEACGDGGCQSASCHPARPKAMRDCYNAFGISETATQSEIKNGFYAPTVASPALASTFSSSLISFSGPNAIGSGQLKNFILPELGKTAPEMRTRRSYSSFSNPTQILPMEDSFAKGCFTDISKHPFVRKLVVTASGPDRPGIVSTVSKRILECGGNLEESRMARLAGDFSILMLISVDSTVPRMAEELRDALLEIDGLQVNTRWTKDDRMKEKAPKRKFRRLSLKGADNPGLVYNVAEYLASNNINIENLETAMQEAPFGGSTLFTMEGVITMPLTMSTRQLSAHLDTLQTTLGVEMTLSNLNPARRAEDILEWSNRNVALRKSKYSSGGKEEPTFSRLRVEDIAI